MSKPAAPGTPLRRRTLLASAGAGLGVGAGLLASGSAWTAPRRPPNFIVVLCDDLGYGDTPLYGTSAIPTPALMRMAAEGIVLTDYYAPANLCSPSRAGLLTGRYPVRTGLGYEVIMQQDDRGLPLSEVTIANALKPAGYATALFGKWHLGHLGPAWPPTRHGFDRFFGIPYSHDMKPLSLFESRAGSEEVKSYPVDYPRLQEDFYDHAERFIEENAARPFFMELALSAPHLPEYPYGQHNGAPRTGPYGEVVQEIDSLVGRLFAKLHALRLENDTVVIFTSDNGPWFEGSPGVLRDRKGGAGFDGGYRVPFVAWAPGRISAGKRTDAIACGIDLLPTFCAMAGAAPPEGVTLDGRDITAVLTRAAPTPHEILVLFDNETPVALRTQRWKYVAAGYYRSIRLPYEALGYEELFDVQADPSESYSVSADNPKIAAQLKTRLAAVRTEFAPFKHKDIPPVFQALRGQLEHMQD